MSIFLLDFEKARLNILSAFLEKCRKFNGVADFPRLKQISLNHQNPLQDDKTILPEKKERRSKPESLRKKITRDAALLHWGKEEKEMNNPQSKIKEYTTPANLARNKDMTVLVALLNKIGGLSPIQEELNRKHGIDPEWFSDLYPGEKKPGPKPKKTKQTSNG